MIEASGPAILGLPLWAQELSLAITLFLAALRAAEFFALPGLYVRLTRDLFFRLIDDGEALFCHAVLLARRGPVLISDVRLTLKRVGSAERAEKLFPIRVLRFGEKVQGTGLLAEHHFYSSSPLQYLPENAPLRAVYLGVQREYQNAQQNSIQDFVAKVLQLKTKHANASPSEALKAEVTTELSALIEEANQRMQRLIQLEQGDYELAIKVTYQAPGRRLWKRLKTSESKIGFNVDEQRLANWKAQLADTLRISAINQLTDSNNPIKYPEFQPLEFQESTEPFA